MLDPTNGQGCFTHEKMDHPVPGIMGATGSLLAGSRPIVCGGLVLDNRTYTRNCYSPGQEGLLVSMWEKRGYPASLPVGSQEGVLWVAGGHNGHHLLASTELVAPDRSASIRGPELPEPLWGHCMAKINSSTAMIIGGIAKDGQLSGRTYYYTTKKHAWIPGPELLTPRSDMTCGLIKDTRTGSVKVVVAGGDDGFELLDSTELLTITDNGGPRWTNGPDLPSAIFGSAGTSSPDGKTFYLFGGDGSKIEQAGATKSTGVQLQCSNENCHWSTIDHKMKTPRKFFVAIPLPKNVSNVC